MAKKQKRSPNTYQKINTIFYRDTNNIIMPYDEFCMPELEYLRDVKFDAEEKIDGTNIRIEVTREVKYDENGTPIGIEWTVEHKGKTDNAQIPPMLLKFLQTEYPTEKVLNALGIIKPVINFEEDADFMLEKRWGERNEKTGGKLVPNLDSIPTKYTLYGEGYGAKIQKCGGRYIKDGVSFIGFDVKVNDLYLLRGARNEVFANLGCDVVPYVGQLTIDEAIKIVREGFISSKSEDREFKAEGLVLRTPIGLCNRKGERIIFKVKTCDFESYRNRYGTNEQVPQTRMLYAGIE